MPHASCRLCEFVLCLLTVLITVCIVTIISIIIIIIIFSGGGSEKFALGQRTFRGLRYDVQLTGDFGINRLLYVSQHGQLSHSSSWDR